MEALQEHREGSWTVGGPAAGQPEYFPLEISRGPEGALWSAWRPSLKERLRILFGAPLRIGILANKQPPIMVTLENPWL